VLADGGSVPALGPGRYETLARIGAMGDAPMFTVTCGDVGSLELSAPSASYLRCIATGLREAHGWDAARSAGYLAGCPGVEGTFTFDDLVTVMGDVVS
jgi:hypothetical protein